MEGPWDIICRRKRGEEVEETGAGTIEWVDVWIGIEPGNSTSVETIKNGKMDMF